MNTTRSTSLSGGRLRTLYAARLLAALALAALLLPGCGRRHHRDYHEGDIWVDNQTHSTAVPTNEDLLTFRVAGFQDPFTGDLLGGSVLGEDSARHIGTFDEDYYDAEGDLELGQIIEWFDVFVGDRRDSYFVVE